MIFRGKFRSRILILCVVALVVLFQLDNINTVISDFIADNEQHEPALEQERQPGKCFKITLPCHYRNGGATSAVPCRITQDS